MRAVGMFCAAAVILSVIVWFNQSLLEILALAPIGSEQSNVLLLLPLLFYAFVHGLPPFLLSRLLLILGCGLILEPRTGSRMTFSVILAGVLVPGLTWLVVGEPDLFLTGSSGVAFAMIGGLLYLWHKRRQALAFPERVVIWVLVVWAAIGAVSAIFSPWTTWVPATGVPAGYCVALGLGGSKKKINPPPAKEERQ